MASIFISYRRRHDPDRAGRIAERLREIFGEGEVFLDVHTIERGENWRRRIIAELKQSRFVLAIVGPDWYEEFSKSRDDGQDWVRFELEQALRQKETRVIPVLIGEAQMPRPEAIPNSLQPFAQLNAHEVSNARFDRDVGDLIEIIKEFVSPLETIVETKNVRVPFTLLLGAPNQKRKNRVIRDMAKEGWHIQSQGGFSEGFLGFGAHSILVFQRERQVRMAPKEQSKRVKQKHKIKGDLREGKHSKRGCLGRLFRLILILFFVFVAIIMILTRF